MMPPTLFFRGSFFDFIDYVPFTMYEYFSRRKRLLRYKNNERHGEDRPAKSISYTVHGVLRLECSVLRLTCGVRLTTVNKQPHEHKRSKSV